MKTFLKKHNNKKKSHVSALKWPAILRKVWRKTAKD